MQLRNGCRQNRMWKLIYNRSWFKRIFHGSLEQSYLTGSYFGVGQRTRMRSAWPSYSLLSVTIGPILPKQLTSSPKYLSGENIKERSHAPARRATQIELSDNDDEDDPISFPWTFCFKVSPHRFSSLKSVAALSTNPLSKYEVTRQCPPLSQDTFHGKWGTTGNHPSTVCKKLWLLSANLD